MEGSSGLDSRRTGEPQPVLSITGCMTLEKAIHLSMASVIIHSFILSFSKHFLNPCCGPGTVLRKETTSNKTTPAMEELTALRGEKGQILCRFLTTLGYGQRLSTGPLLSLMGTL